ncbi:hypothetical protein D0Y65_028239, partial [Glycine soja]
MISDSTYAISIIRSTNMFHPSAVIIKRIQALLCLSRTVHVRHTLHQGNAWADFLAKKSASQEKQFLTWNDPTSEDISTVLMADAMGVAFTRE